MKPTLVLLGLLALSACEPPADSFEFTREKVPVWRAAKEHPAPAAEPRELRVMAWNIKYGAGRIDFWFDFWGDRVQMTVDEVDGNMKAIYALINEVDPDILMTEEIEVNSRRSAYYDMVQGILDHTNLRYGAYFQTWNSRYVPSEGVGRIDLGNAIFSRHPIVLAERIKQVDRSDLDPATRTFYIHRAIGRAEIQAGARKVAAYVVHTEAYDKDETKRNHIRQIHETVKGEALPFVLGGDFNELPPVAARKVNFPDERKDCGDFCQPPYHPEDMQRFYDDFNASIQLDRYGTTEEQQRRWYTHTVLGPDTVNDEGQKGFWNRTLDYLFIRKADAWAAGSTDVLQSPGHGEFHVSGGLRSDPMKLSDHAPVVGTWVLP